MKKLTLAEFNKLPKYSIFRTGIISNSETGIHMTNDASLPLLKYVAFKGHNDFTIYIGKPEQSDEHIADHGDKSFNPSTIDLCISCDDEVKALYRK